MSDLSVILENIHIFDTPHEIREQINAAREDIASWQSTIEQNTDKMLDLCLESMQCRIDIERTQGEFIRLRRRLAKATGMAVQQ